MAPLAEDRVAAFVVEADGVATGVTLNPYTGEVLQTFPWRAGWYDFANEVHGTLFLGAFGDRMIEIAASLGIVLIVSGLYLHWPGMALDGAAPSCRKLRRGAERFGNRSMA